MATFTSNWISKILGVAWYSLTTYLGRTDLVRVGTGLRATWDATNAELTLDARETEDATSADVAVAADSAPHVVHSVTLPGTASSEQAHHCYARLRVWERTDRTNRLTGEATFEVQLATGAAAFEGGSATFSYSDTIAGVSAALAMTGDATLQVSVTSTTTPVYASCLVRYEQAESLTQD